MIAKTSCQHCGIHIEFEAEDANQLAPCPSCGKQTRLLVPSNSSKPAIAKGKFCWKKDWPKVAAGFCLAVVIVASMWALKHYSGMQWGEISGTVSSWMLGIGFIAFVVFIVIVITREKLWLPLLAAALFAVGAWHFFSGMTDWNDTMHRENGTVMQQQLAELEMVGGAVVAGVGLLVYIGQHILKAVTNRK